VAMATSTAAKRARCMKALCTKGSHSTSTGYRPPVPDNAEVMRRIISDTYVA
jgi:hypothetical protein